jgi:hypothetical protein
MPGQRGTLQVIGATLTRVLLPLHERFSTGEVSHLLAELGLRFPNAINADPAVGSASRAIADAIRNLEPVLAALDQAVADDDAALGAVKGLELVAAVGRAVDGFVNLASAVRSFGGGVPAGELTAFCDALPAKIADYLFVRALESLPGVGEALDFIGVIKREAVPGVDALHPPFVRRSFSFTRLTEFLGDPLGTLGAIYGWGQSGFDGVNLLSAVNRLAASRGVPALLDLSGPTPTLDIVFLEVTPKTNDPKGLTIKMVQPFVLQGSTPLAQDDWVLNVSAAGGLKVGSELVVTPDDGVSIVNPGATKAEGKLGAVWTAGKPNAPTIILGEPGGSRLEVEQFVLDGGVGLAWNAGRGSGTFKIGGMAKGGKLVVSLANADGFIGTVLGGLGLESGFDLGLGYSSADGLFFAGSAVLEIQLPLHLDLGPVEISALTISAGLADGKVPLGLRTDIKAMLGPLQAVVEQIGIGADLSFPPGRNGNAGPVDFQLRFLPPKGAGLSLDLAVIRGGGYLFMDSERGEYAGALELILAETIGVQAIGIINTKMPDGKDGFSLLIMMSVDFGAGFQLGYGFTLSAIGGLIGLNRTMNLQALAEGVRSGAIMSVMFPQDIIANAPKIISDLKAFFPPQEGKFLIGPMLKIGWGTPTLVSISVGVIIEIPGNIAIVGVLRVALPTEEAAILNLQVNFIGAIELDRDRLWFFASLYDSRVLFLTLEGEMGLLVAYGDDANFVLSAGGFHPDFRPPALPFPSPVRIAVSLLSTPVSMVRVQCYFAVTSNTAQFGAMVEVRFGLSEVNVSGHLAFDALFQFSPFAFVIRISASLSAKVFGIGLFSVSISGQLSGPSPWRIVGRGEISLLFFDVSCDFEETWGEDRRKELPSIAILPLLEAELGRPDNWRALPPVGARLSVTLRSMSASEAGMILHPLGMLRVSQRKMPLGLKLDTFGNQKPNDVNKLSIVVAGGELERKADVLDRFAPAQFQTFTDAEKISKPAFTQELAGLDLGPSGADMQSSRMIRRNVRYEEIIIDNNYKRFSRRFRLFASGLFSFLLGANAAAKCSLSQAVAKKVDPFSEKIVILGESFTVVSTSNNKAFGAAATFHSEASAREFMAAQVANDVSLSGALQVVPSVEVAA